MTFDDGILIVKTRTNTAENGLMASYSYVEKARYFFGFDYVGYNRYYEAMKAQVQIEHVVNVPEWIDIDGADVVELEDGVMYRLAQIQRTWDDGLKITKLSLERVKNAL